MIRTSFVATFLLAIGGGVYAQSGDSPPSAPGQLVARAYGPSSGGIAWSRSSDDRAVRGYEITRDGVVLGVRDTLSYIAQDLAPGRGYDFSVVAIDSAGQRSDRAIARIETPDARPDRPSGLSANLYSATAAGIAWERSGVFGERYEVRRDGVVVAAATNGTSHVDTDLRDRRRYLFEVIAINRQGLRSPAARLFVRTEAEPNVPRAAGPAAPSGLRAIVYSAKAGAIAWNRPSASVLRHEVRRDGEVRAITDGISHVDGNLASGRAYAYSVVAIDRNGRRSKASRVMLTIPKGTASPPVNDPFAVPDPSGGTTLERLGYAASRDLAADLVSAAWLEPYFDVDTTVRGLVVTFNGPERTVDCPGGGTARGTGTGFAFTALELDGCVIKDRTLTGTLERTESTRSTANGEAAQLAIAFDDLRVDVGKAGALTVTGSFVRRASQGEDERCGRYATTRDSIRIVSARLERGGDVSDLKDATYSRSDDKRNPSGSYPEGAPCDSRQTLTFEGRASVVSTRFGAKPATVSIGGDIVRDYREREDSRAAAMLEADFGDGSELMVTAASGSSKEVQVDIVSSGSAVSFNDEYAFEVRPFAITLF